MPTWVSPWFPPQTSSACVFTLRWWPAFPSCSAYNLERERDSLSPLTSVPSNHHLLQSHNWPGQNLFSPPANPAHTCNLLLTDVSPPTTAFYNLFSKQRLQGLGASASTPSLLWQQRPISLKAPLLTPAPSPPLPLGSHCSADPHPTVPGRGRHAVAYILLSLSPYLPPMEWGTPEQHTLTVYF